ncbi:hypothetical protein CRENBAI_012274 [Crenichthys baileyi]|uniref:Uncharacterized protein n=1 Tax=Crenichthys baileyi TaxID=28760 RepID=A0AAV9QLL8_9TELE
MIPPTTDPADKQKADALDRWVQRQKEEAMRNLSKNLEVLPSPLLVAPFSACFPGCSPRNRGRAGVNSQSAGEEVVSLLADVRTAASKPASSSATALSARLATANKPAPLSATANFPRLAAARPMPSSAWCSDATPEELEERLRFFARQIKSFRRISLMYSSPKLMERITQMERDYETAGAAAAEQPAPGLQGAAAAAAAAEQPTPGLQPAVELPEGPEGGLPPLPGPEHLLSFLWGVLMELKSDTPQPVSTSSTRRRGRRKRGELR